MVGVEAEHQLALGASERMVDVAGLGVRVVGSGYPLRPPLAARSPISGRWPSSRRRSCAHSAVPRTLRASPRLPPAARCRWLREHRRCGRAWLAGAGALTIASRKRRAAPRRRSYRAPRATGRRRPPGSQPCLCRRASRQDRQTPKQGREQPSPATASGAPPTTGPTGPGAPASPANLPVRLRIRVSRPALSASPASLRSLKGTGRRDRHLAKH